MTISEAKATKPKETDSPEWKDGIRSSVDSNDDWRTQLPLSGGEFGEQCRVDRKRVAPDNQVHRSGEKETSGNRVVCVIELRDARWTRIDCK